MAQHAQTLRPTSCDGMDATRLLLEGTKTISAVLARFNLRLLAQPNSRGMFYIVLLLGLLHVCILLGFASI